MLATLSSFLPHNILQTGQHNNNENNKEEVEEEETATDDDRQRAPIVEKRKKRQRKQVTNETFIVVRPPPSKSNHPLNLQVQLVPPPQPRRKPTQASSANASQETLESAAADHAPGPPELARSTSAQTSGSTTTGTGGGESLYSNTSNTSLSSLSSLHSASGGGGSRRIIPLYNLSAHNVMPNTVLDAGTDAKVARFFKRGIEVVGVGVLEPVEVWGTKADTLHRVVSRPAAGSVLASNASATIPSEYGSTSELGHGTSSAQHHHQQQATQQAQSQPPAPTGSTAAAQPAPNATKKLFGKLFKRKETPPPPPPTEIKRDPSPPQVKLVPPPPPGPGPGPSPTSASGEPTLCPPILSTQPLLHSPTIPPTASRATAYIWVVRKWSKRSGEGWWQGVVGDALTVGGMVGTSVASTSKSKGRPMSLIGPAGAAAGIQDGEDIEVRFEWVRGRNAEQRRRDKARKEAAAAAVAAESGEPPEKEKKKRRGGSRPNSRPNTATGEKEQLGAIASVARTATAVGGATGAVGGSHRRHLSIPDKTGVAPPPAPSSDRGHGHGHGKFASASPHFSPPISTAAPAVHAHSTSPLASPPTSPPGSPLAAEGPGLLRSPSKKMNRLSFTGLASSFTNLRIGNSGGSQAQGTPSSPVASTPTTAVPTVGGVPITVTSATPTTPRGFPVPPPTARPGMHTIPPAGVPTTAPANQTSFDPHLSAQPPSGHGHPNGGGGAGRAPSPNPPASVAHTATTEDSAEDALGEESDPEDSETPWTCTLHVLSNAPGDGGDMSDDGTAGAGMGNGGRTTRLRVKLATLAPAPHHPKVVAQLKVPFPLPDIDIDRCALRKRGRRVSTASVSAIPPMNNEGDGLVLTAEEMKDVVSTTGMWLVIRESFGGVAKKKRKGDGWRIRA